MSEALASRVRGMISRAIVGLVSDAFKMQTLQVTLLAGQTPDDVERFQTYGHTSVPLPGAEGVALKIGGSTGHTIVICVDDRRYRLTGLQPGEVALYDDLGHKVHLTRNGIVIDGSGHQVTMIIAAGVANIAVEALLPAQLGNAVITTPLTLTSPLPNVNAVASAFTALGGGADIEPVERWRARIMLRIRKPPQGGADYDFEGWALEVPGVTRAWVYPQEQGGGTVVVRFVRDDDVSIIPDGGAVATVQAYIDARRPVTAETFVLAPVATPQNFTIQPFPNTADVKAAITAELRELYRREAKPGGTMLISNQREAVSISAGETDHVMSIPNANQAHTVGQLPTLGVITWV